MTVPKTMKPWRSQDKVFRFVESKPFPQLVPEQEEIYAHLEDDQPLHNLTLPTEAGVRSCIRRLGSLNVGTALI